MQSFVNEKTRVESDIQKKTLPEFLYKLGYKIVKKQIDKVNKIAGNFRYFTPFKDIFEEAEEAEIHIMACSVKILVCPYLY